MRRDFQIERHLHQFLLSVADSRQETLFRAAVDVSIMIDVHEPHASTTAPMSVCRFCLASSRASTAAEHTLCRTCQILLHQIAHRAHHCVKVFNEDTSFHYLPPFSIICSFQYSQPPLNGITRSFGSESGCPESIRHNFLRLIGSLETHFSGKSVSP